MKIKLIEIKLCLETIKIKLKNQLQNPNIDYITLYNDIDLKISGNLRVKELSKHLTNIDDQKNLSYLYLHF